MYISHIGKYTSFIKFRFDNKSINFQPIFFNLYLSNKKTAFVYKSRVEPTIFFIEKISFSLKLFSGHFYGQSFIKTVRGPLLTTLSKCSRCVHIVLSDKQNLQLQSDCDFIDWII